VSGIDLLITDRLVEQFAELMPVSGQPRPTSLRGWPRPNGYWRKIVVEYPNGWVLTINFNQRGQASSSHARFKFKSVIRPEPPQ